MWQRLLLLAAVWSAALSETINGDLVIKSADTNVDISSQLAKIGHKLVVHNSGTTGVKNVLVALPVHLKPKVSFVGAKAGEHQLRVSSLTVGGHADKAFWTVELRQELGTGRSVALSVDMVLHGALVPHPSHITQREKQLVLYEGNAYFFSYGSYFYVFWP